MENARTQRAKFSEQLVHRSGQLRIGNHARDEADAAGLRRADLIASEDQIRSRAHPDALRRACETQRERPRAFSRRARKHDRQFPLRRKRPWGPRPGKSRSRISEELVPTPYQAPASSECREY